MKAWQLDDHVTLLYTHFLYGRNIYAILLLDARGPNIKKHHHPHKRAIVDGKITMGEAMTLETFRDETLSFPQPHNIYSLTTRPASRLLQDCFSQSHRPTLHLSIDRVIGAVVTFDGACEALVAFA